MSVSAAKSVQYCTPGGRPGAAAARRDDDSLCTLLTWLLACTLTCISYIPHDHASVQRPVTPRCDRCIPQFKNTLSKELAQRVPRPLPRRQPKAAQVPQKKDNAIKLQPTPDSGQGRSRSCGALNLTFTVWYGSLLNRCTLKDAIDCHHCSKHAYARVAVEPHVSASMEQFDGVKCPINPHYFVVGASTSCRAM